MLKVVCLILFLMGPFANAQICLSGKCKMKKAKHGKYDESMSDEQIAETRPLAIWDASSSDTFNLVLKIQEIQKLLVPTSQPNQDSEQAKLIAGYAKLLIIADDQTFDDFKYWEVESDEPGGKKFRDVFNGSMVAKNAAFAFALRVIKNPLTGVELILANPDSSSHMVILNGYRDRALNILKGLNRKGSRYKPAPNNMNDFGLYRCQEITQYVSAYELLRVTSTFRTVDSDDLFEAKLALQGAVRNVYRKTGSLLKNHSNNHTLMYAGAMGLAAVVLHDAGHGKRKKNYHSLSWAEDAHKYLNATLFGPELVGWTDRMSDKDTMVGYAEGPHYFLYGFQSLAPFLIAYKNFVPKNHVENIAGITVSNYDHSQAFHRLYQWYNEILMPTGIHPPYDNTIVNDMYPYFFKILNGGKHYFYPVTGNEGINEKSPGTGMVAEFAYLPETIASTNKVQVRTYDNIITNNKSGNMILSSPFGDSLEDDSKRVSFQLFSENGVALNGGGHEHADVNSFIISSGKYSLILDPGMIGYKHSDWFNKAEDHNVFSTLV